MEFLINLVFLLLLQNRAYSTAGHSAVRRKSSYKGLVKRSRSISVYHEPSGGTSRKLLLMIVLYYISRLYETSAVIEIPNWAMNVIWHCTRFVSRSSVIDLAIVSTNHSDAVPIQNQSYFGQLVLYRARAGKMWALGVNLAQEIFLFFFFDWP